MFFFESIYIYSMRHPHLRLRDVGLPAGGYPKAHPARQALHHCAPELHLAPARYMNSVPTAEMATSVRGDPFVDIIWVGIDVHTPLLRWLRTQHHDRSP